MLALRLCSVKIFGLLPATTCTMKMTQLVVPNARTGTMPRSGDYAGWMLEFNGWYTCVLCGSTSFVHRWK